MRSPVCGVGPARDVAGGEDARHARFQVLVHRDAAVHRQSGLFRDRHRRPDADAHDDEVAVERGAAAERHRPPVDPRHRLARVEGDALRLVQRSDEPSHLGAHDPLERRALRRDDIDGNAAGPQRRRDLQTDEAGADHDDTPGRCGPFDDRAAVRERAQVVAPGRRPRRESAAARDRRRSRGAARRYGRSDPSSRRTVRRAGSIDDHAMAEHQLDALLHVEVIRPERNPIVLRFTGEDSPSTGSADRPADRHRR